MVQWKTAVFERQLILEGPIFHFHDYGRKGKSFINCSRLVSLHPIPIRGTWLREPIIHCFMSDTKAHVFFSNLNLWHRMPLDSFKAASCSRFPILMVLIHDSTTCSFSEIIRDLKSAGQGTCHPKRAPSSKSGPLLSIYRVAFSSSFTLPGDMFPNVDRIGQAAALGMEKS